MNGVVQRRVKAHEGNHDIELRRAATMISSCGARRLVPRGEGPTTHRMSALRPDAAPLPRWVPKMEAASCAMRDTAFTPPMEDGEVSLKWRIEPLWTFFFHDFFFTN